MHLSHHGCEGLRMSRAGAQSRERFLLYKRCEIVTLIDSMLCPTRDMGGRQSATGRALARPAQKRAALTAIWSRMLLVKLYLARTAMSQSTFPYIPLQAHARPGWQANGTGAGAGETSAEASSAGGQADEGEGPWVLLVTRKARCPSRRAALRVLGSSEPVAPRSAPLKALTAAHAVLPSCLGCAWPLSLQRWDATRY